MFTIVTSMIIIVNKSSISVINTFVEERSRICEQLDFLLVDLDEGPVYLGFTLKSKSYLKMGLPGIPANIEK